MFTLHDAASMLRNERVNVQLEFVLTEDGETLFNARATYWRGSEHSERMYLVAELTLDETIISLACAMEDRQFTKTDWRARLTKPGVYGVRTAKLNGAADMGGSDSQPKTQYPYTRT